jgi:alkylation response protein AidB-like acyl-CoA dehydrogenase
MDFALNEEQTLLRDSVRRFVEQDCGFERRSIEHEGGFSAGHWAQFAQMGWLGAALPESVGGFGGGAIETSIIAEQLGRGLVLEPFVPVAVLAAQLLVAAAGAQAALNALGALIDGASIVVPAVGEPAGLDLVARDGALHLSGQRTLVVGGPQADQFLVAAAEAGGLSLFMLPAAAAGLSRHDYRLIDGTPACDLRFDAVSVTANQRIGVRGGAATALDWARQQATVALCAQALGVMDRAIDTTREYLLQRQQFGVAIASFQALRHRLADMLIAHQQARATLHGALAGSAHGPGPELTRAVAIAKAQCGRSGRFIGAQAIQLHGGMGMSDECIVGHCFKQLMVFDALNGNAATQLRLLAGSGYPS